jgi:hypothetical protein
MNAKLLATALVGLLTASCAAPSAEVVEERPVVSTAEALTLAECAAQRDTCFQRYPFFGLFTCPAQYTQCVATASNGIPAQVTAAIGDVADCVAQGIDCRGDANDAGDLLVCTTEEAECVAAIVGAQIPSVVTGTAECIDGAVDCVNASESVSDLAGCAETLEQCAVEEVIEGLPPQVGEVVEDVAECTIRLDNCNAEANSASDLSACAEDYIVCVGDGLGVTLEVPPVSDAIACAEEAAECTFEARTLGALGDCADGYVECTIDLVEEQLTCEQQFNSCMSENPFGFIFCSLELWTCQD